MYNYWAVMIDNKVGEKTSKAKNLLSAKVEAEEKSMAATIHRTTTSRFHISTLIIKRTWTEAEEKASNTTTPPSTRINDTES